MLETLISHSPYPDYGIYCLLCGDEYMKLRNKNDRKINESTDILSYRIFQFEKKGIIPPKKDDFKKLGNLIVSVPYVEMECRENNIDLAYQLPRVLAHGIFHLLGYDHQTKQDDEEMEHLENQMVSKYHQSLGIPLNPYKSTSELSRKELKDFNFIKHLV